MKRFWRIGVCLESGGGRWLVNGMAWWLLNVDTERKESKGLENFGS